MALTPEQLEERVSKRVLPKARQEFTWGEFVSMVQGLGLERRNELLEMFVNNQGEAAGRILQSEYDSATKANAASEAATILANSSISGAELDRVFE